MTKYILPVIFVAAAFIVLEMSIHLYLLADIYGQTPNLWRDMKDINPLGGVLVSLIYSFLFVLFYDKIVEQKNDKAGIKFGLLLGLVVGFGWASSWMFLPISLQLAAIWFCVSVFELTIAGFIVGKSLK